MYTHLLLFCVQRDARLLQNVDIGGNRGVVVQIMKESRMVGTNWGQLRHKFGTGLAQVLHRFGTVLAQVWHRFSIGFGTGVPPF